VTAGQCDTCDRTDSMSMLSMVASQKTSTAKSSTGKAGETAAVSTSARPGVVSEHCEREYFDAECGVGDVILMRSAVFGRMREGRCVQSEYGSIGCRADVLATVDSLCSGRRRCRFHVSTLHSARPCPTQLVSYLEAGFDCVTGTFTQAFERHRYWKRGGGAARVYMFRPSLNEE